MKNTRSQVGSTRVTLIIILILVVIVGVGLVVWKSIANRSEAASQSAGTASPATGPLAFADWNATVMIVNADDYYVKRDLSAGDLYNVYSKKAVAACSAAGGAKEAPSNKVGRYKLDAKAESGDYDGQTNRDYYTKHKALKAIYIGDYAYVDAGKGSQPCVIPTSSEGAAADETWARSSAAFSAAFSSLSVK